MHLDVDGKKIREGDVLTYSWFDNEDPIKDMRRKFSHMEDWSDAKINTEIHKPIFVVKKNEKRRLFGEGIHNKLYLHDFRFKHTKVIIK